MNVRSLFKFYTFGTVGFRYNKKDLFHQLPLNQRSLMSQKIRSFLVYSSLRRFLDNPNKLNATKLTNPSPESSDWSLPVCGN